MEAAVDESLENAAPAEPLSTSPGRSRNMAAIRRTNTKPEVRLRQALHASGLRFRKDMALKVGDVRARPDVVFTKKKVAVFVDGCFWHCCPEHGRLPTRNTTYWLPKLQRNVDRDARQNQALRESGWTVLRVWEHVPLSDATALVCAAVLDERTT